MNAVTIPAPEVSGPYVLDPETEDLIWGDELREGMVVIAESTSLRSTLFNNRVLETNRWCRVTKLRRSGDLVSFIGAYVDGSKFARSYNVSWAWFVKLASIETEASA